MGPDLLAELAQIDGVVGVKQANGDELQPIDGLAVLAGNDGDYLACLELGGAGCISVASHIVGPEMRRMYDEPERRAAIDASLARRVRHAVHHGQPDPGQGRAEPARPRRRHAAAADGRGRRGRDRGRPRDARAARAALRGARRRERHPARPPAGRRGRDRQEHDRRRVRRADRRSSTPGCASRPPSRWASTSCCRTSPTCATGPTTSRRSSSPTATRITSAACRGCCASWGRRASPSPTAASSRSRWPAPSSTSTSCARRGSTCCRPASRSRPARSRSR